MDIKIRYIKEKSWLLIVLFIIFPFFETIPFTVPAVDDYTMTLRPFSILTAIQRTNSFYMNWGGGWPFNFMQYVFNPLNFSDPNSLTVGFVLDGFFLIFVITLYYCIRAILKAFFAFEDDMRFVFFTRVLFCSCLFLILNSDIYPEIFYWFVGNSYLWTIIFMMLNITVMADYFEKDNKLWRGILVSILGFVACFSYINAVSSGILYLLFFWERSKKDKSISVINLIPLGFMILGGCLGAFAPGNFKRHEEFDQSGLKIGQAIIFGINNTVGGYVDLLGKEIIVIGILGLLLLGIFCYSERRIKNPCILWLAGFIAVFCNLFCTSLGYSNSSIPNRVLFNANFLVILWGVVSAYNTGAWLREKMINLSEESLIKHILKPEYMLVLFCFFSLILIQQKDSEDESVIQRLPWTKTCKEVEHIIDESGFERGIITEIMESNESNVVIKRKGEDVPEYTGIIKKIGISEKPDYWVNQTVASWFGKETVVYEIIEED